MPFGSTLPRTIPSTHLAPECGHGPRRDAIGGGASWCFAMTDPRSRGRRGLPNVLASARRARGYRRRRPSRPPRMETLVRARATANRAHARSRDHRGRLAGTVGRGSRRFSRPASQRSGTPLVLMVTVRRPSRPEPRGQRSTRRGKEGYVRGPLDDTILADRRRGFPGGCVRWPASRRPIGRKAGRPHLVLANACRHESYFRGGGVGWGGDRHASSATWRFVGRSPDDDASASRGRPRRDRNSVELRHNAWWRRRRAAARSSARRRPRFHRPPDRRVRPDFISPRGDRIRSASREVYRTQWSDTHLTHAIRES